MNFKEMVGSKLKAIRKEQGYTQESVINILKTRNPDFPADAKGWQSWEKGRTMPKDFETFACVCELFGVSSDYMLGLSDEMKPQAKEFQKATGLSESAIANISRYRNNPEIMACINQFLSSADFINAIGNMVIAKSPAVSIPTKEDITENVVQGSKLYQIATGEKKIITDERITLTGERLKEWLLWQTAQDLNRLTERIVKGDNGDGTR